MTILRVAFRVAALGLLAALLGMACAPNTWDARFCSRVPDDAGPSAGAVSGFGFTSFETRGGLGGYADSVDELVGQADIYVGNFNGQEIHLAPSNYTPPGAIDTGVDIRGLGSDATGIGAPLPERAALNPSAGAYFDDGVEDALFAEFDPHFETAVDTEGPTFGTPRVIRKPRSWKPSTLRPNTSRLLVGREDPLPQRAFHAQVRIDGFRARVVLELEFENDRDQELRGSFQLRLPDGASVHYLAFGKSKVASPVPAPPAGVLASLPEIRGASAREIEAPREARMVRRERAAFAFDETVRRQVDPALAEWTGAGVFRVQVFPLEPKTRHRVVVAYDADLVPYRGGLIHRVDLPQGVPDIRVDVDARGGAVQVAPAAKADGGVFRWRNPQGRAIVAGFPRAPGVRLRGEDPATGPCFAARVQPALPDVPAITRERAVFLVDTSLSSRPERLHTWLGLLDAILERNRADLKAFAVLFFNVDAVWWRDGFQANTAANAAALRAYANTLLLEGATDLDRALRAAASHEGAYDLFLLSDGAATWGEDDLHVMATRLGADRALFAYRTAEAGTHVAALEHLARTSGGAVFRVDDEAAIPRAARAHRSRPWRIAAVGVEGATDVMLAGLPASLYPGQTLHVAGRGRPPADAVLELTLRQGARERTVRTPLGAPLDSPLAARTYGRTALGQLEAVGGEGEALAEAYASHFRVVGRSASLLMLESEADYERFGIRPAEDAGRIREEPASTVVRRAMVEQALVSLGDPKVRLRHRLDRLRKLEFLGLKLPSGFDGAFAALAPAAFDAAPRRRASAVRTRAQVPSEFDRLLTARGAPYGAVRAEAERRRAAHGAWDALRALSSLVDARPGDLDLTRDLGLTAQAWGLEDQAYHLLRRVADRRPYQLPTVLAMARCAAALDKPDLALVHYETALASRAVARYGAFAEIATLEYLRFLRDLEAPSAFARQRADELEAARTVREADILILLTWSTDGTDVDLHVTTPDGEECYYEHPKTKEEGRLTTDVTQGFGPEMFVLQRAPHGDYKIEVNYFGSDATRTQAPSRVYVRIYEDYGRPAETLVRRTLELGTSEERRTVTVLRR